MRQSASINSLRYRVNAPLPTMARRRADLLFAGPKVAVFVDGCFWRGCPERGTEVVPGLVEVEAAVPRLSPAVR